MIWSARARSDRPLAAVVPAAHEPRISSLIVAEVPLAGLSFRAPPRSPRGPALSPHEQNAWKRYWPGYS